MKLDLAPGLLIILLMAAAIAASGCTRPAEAGDVAPATSPAFYHLTVQSGGAVDEFDVMVGAVDEVETVLPSAAIGPAFRRPFSLNWQDDGALDAGAEIQRIFGACDGSPGFCATGVVIDMQRFLPVRVYHTDLEVVNDSLLEDGSADSLFWGERNDIGFWLISPLFMAAAWRGSGHEISSIYGRSLDLQSEVRDGVVTVNYRTSSMWHHPQDGENTTIEYRGRVTLDGSLDPVSADLVATEKGAAESSETTYRYRRTHHGDSVHLVDTAAGSSSAAMERKPCGAILEGTLFGDSTLNYAAAFEAIQQDSDFQKAARDERALLTSAEPPRPGEATGGPTDAPIWEFAVLLDDRTIIYEVQERRMLPAAIPQEPEYSILTKRPGPEAPTAKMLLDHSCVELRGLEQKMSAYINRIGADGYRQALTELAPADLAFLYTNGQLEPQARAYGLAFRPFVLDEDGQPMVGPQMSVSLVTGDLVMIS